MYLNRFLDKSYLKTTGAERRARSKFFRAPAIKKRTLLEDDSRPKLECSRRIIIGITYALKTEGYIGVIGIAQVLTWSEEASPVEDVEPLGS